MLVSITVRSEIILSEIVALERYSFRIVFPVEIVDEFEIVNEDETSWKRAFELSMLRSVGLLFT